MNALGSLSQPTAPAPCAMRQCVFCLEDIRAGASVCPHCGSNLSPLQDLADKQTALDLRLAALEQEIAAQRAMAVEQASANHTAPAAPREATALANKTDIRWPHMLDNVFLGLTALLAAHWLVTTIPASNRAAFRLVALVVALPFGFRFERNSRSGTTGQALAALAFGSIGTLAIGVLDLAVGGHAAPPVTAQDIVASVATVALSHYAGSAMAFSRRRRADAARMPASSPNDPRARMHIQPAQVKSTAEAVKALYDAAAPIAAGAAALWAAFGHILF